ncbi:hypothetical protein JD508_15365 [Aeromonas jandaei]|nr:hypothetical protein [Aeromonas jandaei]
MNFHALLTLLSILVITTLRTRIKLLDCKTISFSRLLNVKKKVIGAFIERHHFN